MLMDAKNWIFFSPEITPTHIVPEWYFLPQYAILRRCRKKTGGVILMAIFLFSFFFLGFFNKVIFKRLKVDVKLRVYIFVFLIFLTKFIQLMCLGALVAEFPVGELSMFFLIIHLISLYGLSCLNYLIPC